MFTLFLIEHISELIADYKSPYGDGVINLIYALCFISVFPLVVVLDILFIPFYIIFFIFKFVVDHIGGSD